MKCKAMEEIKRILFQGSKMKLNKLTCLAFSLWNVSHPAGCPGYVKPADVTVNDTATTFCKELALDKVKLHFSIPSPDLSCIHSSTI